MTRQKHLLVKLTEECSEISQVTCKAILFGLDSGYPNSGKTNLDCLKMELNDLFAIIQMLHSEGVDWKIDMEEVNIKKAKVEKWLKTLNCFR